MRLIISLEPMEGLRYLPYLGHEGWLVTNETPFVNIPNYPAESDVMAEINKLPHKVVLNVDKVAKELGIYTSCQHRSIRCHYPVFRH